MISSSGSSTESAAGSSPHLSADQLVEALRLVAEADSVELKLTIPTESGAAAIRALGADPLDAEIRQVYFFDTPGLALNRAGLVLRARRVQVKGDDSVVKLRPVDPAELPAALRALPSFGVEVDAMPGGFVCSASLKRALPKPHARAVGLGEKPIRKLFDSDQRSFYEAHAPAGIELDDLAVLGPIFVLKLRIRPDGWTGNKLVGELWLYPDGSIILELSTKCAPPDAMAVGAEVRTFLERRGIDLGAEQQTKTKTALEHFVAVP